MGTAFNQNPVFFTPQKRDRWASEATNLPTYMYLVRLVLKIFFARPLLLALLLAAISLPNIVVATSSIARPAAADGPPTPAAPLSPFHHGTDEDAEREGVGDE